MLLPWIAAIVVAALLLTPTGLGNIDYCGNDTTRDAAGESHSINDIRGEITPCVTIEIEYE